MGDNKSKNDIIGRVFFGKFQAIKKIGQGSFGQVYEGINNTNKEKVAIKFVKYINKEVIQELKSEHNNLLESEAYRLIFLKNNGIPKVICFGNNKKYNILVLELLGKSLEYLFSITSKKFSVKTTCNLAIQILERIKAIHNNYHIHRDIKPDNFVMGIENNQKKVYLIDFGLSKKYKSQSKGTHIPFKTNKNITGTARYCSINTHNGHEQARRDDLESIGYMLLYFLRGVLPWQGLKIDKNDDHYTLISQKKQSTSIEELCKGYPSI